MTIFTLDISLRNQPDFRLLMEIESDQDLFCLHLFILKSVGLEEGEMASFYKNYETMNDRIEVCLCDLQKNDRNFLMTDLQINNLLNLTPWAMPIMLRASGFSAKPVAVVLCEKIPWISGGW